MCAMKIEVSCEDCGARFSRETPMARFDRFLCPECLARVKEAWARRRVALNPRRDPRTICSQCGASRRWSTGRQNWPFFLCWDCRGKERLRHAERRAGQAIARPPPPPIAVEARSLREGVEELLFRVLQPRQKAIVTARWGLDDGRRKTLEEVGHRHGITRERVRQIERRAVGRLEQMRTLIQIPVAHKAVAALSGISHVLSQRQIVQALKDEGVGVDGRDIAALELLTALKIIRIPRSVDLGAARMIVNKATRVIRLIGAVQSSYLASEFDRLNVSLDAVAGLLEERGFQAIGDGWFTLQVQDSTFIDRVRRILTYANAVSPRTIRAAFRRWRRLRVIAFPLPPSSILVRVLAGYPEFRLADDFICWKPPVDIQPPTLRGVERAVIEFADKRGPVVSFIEVCDYVRSLGYSQASAIRALGESQLIRRVAHNLYARLGAPIDSADVAAATARLPAEIPHEPTFSYRSDGTVELELNVGTAGAYSGAIYAGPGAVMHGEWSLEVEGVHTGTLRVGRYWAYGLARAFDKLAVQRGDRVRLTFDTARRSVRVSVIAKETGTS